MVDGVKASGIGGASPLARDGTKTPAGQFSVGENAAPPSENARLSSVPAIGLASMLALQAVDEAIERDRAARKHGSAILAALTSLQRAMLADTDPSVALSALSQLSSECPIPDDPGLGAILRAVVLRSRLEIARRGIQGTN